MPELPEVECVRRSLARHLVGRRVVSVRVNRSDVIRGGSGGSGQSKPADLLAGQRIAELARHGKQLALVSDPNADGGGCVAIHLGMSGRLCIVPALTQRTTRPAGSPTPADLPPHTHVVWHLDDGSAVRFTDPRRFGGVWCFASRAALVQRRWARLGPDALVIRPADLARRLSGTGRCLKAALLDQALVAGLGNIYVDELLYACRLSPQTPANAITTGQVRGLVRRMRRLLGVAIDRGGSSLRDYVDADSRAGSQQTHHRVYGRAGLVCGRRGCAQVIVARQIAGRTTAWCPGCQAGPAG